MPLSTAIAIAIALQESMRKVVRQAEILCPGKELGDVLNEAHVSLDLAIPKKQHIVRGSRIEADIKEAHKILKAPNYEDTVKHLKRLKAGLKEKVMEMIDIPKHQSAYVAEEAS